MAPLNLPLACIAVALLAGCASPSTFEHTSQDTLAPLADESAETAPAGESPEAAPPATGSADVQDMAPAGEPRRVQVYSSRGLLMGTREDMFVAPPGTVALAITPHLRLGAWSGGLKIVHESGVVVYQDEYQAAAHDGGWGGCLFGHCTSVDVGQDRWTADAAPPGNYTVQYNVIGAVDATVIVEALIEA